MVLEREWEKVYNLYTPLSRDEKDVRDFIDDFGSKIRVTFMIKGEESN